MAAFLAIVFTLLQIPPPDTTVRTRARVLALWWLLLCLVLAPTLGQLHHVAHGGVAGQRHTAGVGHEAHGGPRPHAGHAHGKAAALVGADTAASATLLGGLVPGHAPADCLLLDQLALGDALHLATAALPAVAPLAAASFRCAISGPAQPLALFQARAPPRG